MTSTGFGWILLACVLYGLVHSLLASNTVKGWAARAAGQVVYRRVYRLFFSIMGALTAVPLLVLVASLPDQTIYTIPTPWNYAAMLVQGLALLGLLLGVLQTGAFRFIGLQQIFEPSQPSAQPEKLVVDGLYRYVRHPLYTCSLLLLWLSPVMTWNSLALSLGFSAYLLLGSIFEECKLVEQFGSSYEDYRRRTPRIIPGLRL